MYFDLPRHMQRSCSLEFRPFQPSQKKNNPYVENMEGAEEWSNIKKKLGIKVLDMRLTHDVYVYMHAGLATSVQCGRWLFCYFRAAAV